MGAVGWVAPRGPRRPPSEEPVKDSTPVSAEPPGTASHPDQGQAGRSRGESGGRQEEDEEQSRSRPPRARVSQRGRGWGREGGVSIRHTLLLGEPEQVPVVPRPTSGLEATWLLFITSLMKIPSLLKCLVHLLASHRSHQGTRIRTREPPSHMTTSRL